MEKRNVYFTGDFKTRAESDGQKIIEGYFAVFNQRTELWDDFFEEIVPGAFDESLKTNDIRCLFNHNSDVVLGRNGSNTLTLHADTYGLYGSVVINPNDTQATDIYARVERGDITGCSFGFNTYFDDEEYIRNPDGTTLCRVLKADVREISICPFPAYPQTVIQARKNDYETTRTQKIKSWKESIKKRMEAMK